MRLTKQPSAWRCPGYTEAVSCVWMFCLEAAARSGIGAQRLKVSRKCCHRDGKLHSRMCRRGPVLTMLVKESLLNLDARRTLARKRPCPVDLKALSADRTAYVAIAL